MSATGAGVDTDQGTLITIDDDASTLLTGVADGANLVTLSDVLLS